MMPALDPPSLHPHFSFFCAAMNDLGFFHLFGQSATMPSVSVRDVLLFHKLDRAIYERLLALGTAPEVARNVVALFMWLELIGIDVVRHILDHRGDRYVVLRLAAEAQAILDCIRHEAPLRDSGGGALSIPVTASLVAEPLDLRFFQCHRDVAVRGVANMVEEVGTVIFHDGLNRMLAEYEAAVEAARGRRERDVALPRMPEELARPFRVRAAPQAEDSRSMFITFSKGFPLSREEIVEYFTEKWGNCVERVMMEKTTGAEVTPVYGRIVFTSEAFIGLVLNGNQVVKFNIRGRQLWARKYEKRKREAV